MLFAYLTAAVVILAQAPRQGQELQQTVAAAVRAVRTVAMEAVLILAVRTHFIAEAVMPARTAMSALMGPVAPVGKRGAMGHAAI